MELSLKRLLIVCAYTICVLIVCEIGTISAQRTILDKFIDEYRKFRGGLFKFVGRSDTESSYLWNLKRQVNHNPEIIPKLNNHAKLKKINPNQKKSTK